MERGTKMFPFCVIIKVSIEMDGDVWFIVV